ncbi:hypothetical protein HH310_09715 [Actinoplanes sp. TBRC 11911]|uniref:NPP1 family protein n=1 Tax=Actinoplanes sp. TBRC 11911 TaxID=2729386 RepID=UPI00145CE5AC|nr:NPP1 family protein [Actinoplanes sp. TBRC 11911]NMO51465.1 hypothetical protein [Actinoplanes sp. TBRC 11911]
MGLVSALAAVQVALRVVAAHGAAYFDVLVAKQLSPGLSGTVAGLVAGSGVPVGWRMAPFSGHITASWVLEQRSALALVAVGPLLGSAVLGLFAAGAARVLALPKRPLLVASAFLYASFAGIAQAATHDPGAAASMRLSMSGVWTVAAAAGWALAVGGVVVRFFPAARLRPASSAWAARQRTVRATAVVAAVAVAASLLPASAASAAPPKPQPTWQAPGVGDALAQIQRETGHQLNVARNPLTGTPSTLGGLRSPLAGRDVAGWLHAHAKVFGVADTNGMLSKVTGRVQLPDPSGARHVWYDQSIHGVPVYNARLGVHLDAAGTTVTAVTNGLRPDLIAPASTVPTVRGNEAVDVAGKTMQQARTTAAPSLVVYAGRARQGLTSPSALAWQIDLMDTSGFSERVFVDALHKGVIVAVQPLTETAAAAAVNPPKALPQNATVNDLKWAPDVDYDTDSCYNVPAIGPDGTLSQGLPHDNVTASQDCRDQSDLDNTNAYSRQRCNSGWCVYIYDYYFEKDVAVQNVADVGGHVHDWEHIAVWVKDDQAQYVAASGHGEYDIQPASAVRWDGTHPKVVYHKDGGSTHRFRIANAGDEPPENFYHTWRRPALVSYNGFPSGLGDKLHNANWNGPSMATRDAQFADDIKKAIPKLPPECHDLPHDAGQLCDDPLPAFPFVYNLDEGSPGNPDSGASGLNRKIFDMKHQTNAALAVQVRAEGGTATSDADTNDAYNQSGVVYNFYKTKFGRNSIDGNGMPLQSYVHYDNNYQNAFWNGSTMTYGDGMLSQDVSGHEMTHGVTEKTAGLQYQFESGSLNESISDFFGEMTERAAKGANDWLVGSDMKAMGPIRSMADPTAYDQPRHMSAYVETCFDNGGVHTNSGIPNYAFYRMSSLLSADTTTDILWRALTQYLSPTSTFADARTAMVTAASDLYGPASREASVTVTVWENEVGVTEFTPDPRPDGCGGITIVCSTLEQVYGNAGALAAGGAPVEDVAGSLIHMYELGTVTKSPAVAYYDKLFLDNRDDIDATLHLEGPLLTQFVTTVQAWAPVLQAVGTAKADTVVLTQSQIDSAGAFVTAMTTAANEQGKPKLAQMLPVEWGRIDAQHLVGLTVTKAVRYLDGIAQQVPAATPGTAASSLAATFNNVSVTQESATKAGNMDGNGASFSAQQLAATGVTPGSAVSRGGVALTWPSTAGSGKADNTVANGQTIALGGTGDTLGFLVSASYGPAGGTGTVFYSDKTSQQFSLNSPDWSGDGADKAISTAFVNRQGNQKAQVAANVYYSGVPLRRGKTPVSVQLPAVSAAATAGTPTLHVYAMGLGKGAASLESAFNNVAVTQDGATDVGDFDGRGGSFSAQALAAAGVKPGATLTKAGLGFTWPATAGVTQTSGNGTFGRPDNAVASGQSIAVDGTQGKTLGFLVAASYGTAGGNGTVFYSDGTSQQFSLSSPDWFGGTGDAAISTAYQNRHGTKAYPLPAYVYYAGVSLQSGKTPVRVQLPNVSSTAVPNKAALHVFAMKRG